MTIKRRRRYGAEFKKEAIQLYEKSRKGSRQIEKELGIPQGMLSRWSREFKADSVNAFRGNGKMRILYPCASGQGLSLGCRLEKDQAGAGRGEPRRMTER